MAPTCFGLRPSSGSSQFSVDKVILVLKHSVRLRRNLLCGGVAACPSMACVSVVSLPYLDAHCTIMDYLK